MDLVWENPPAPDGPFFTKDAYDQYSLAPSVRELWDSLQSPAESGSAEPNCDAPSATKDAAELNNKSWDDMDIDSSFTDDVPDGCKNTEKAVVPLKNQKKATDDEFPQPRLPFPCTSSLSSKEQSVYLGFLCNKKLKDPPQPLKSRVDQEVMQFQQYLQDVAKICADDYRFIPQEALQYVEDYFKACLECIQALPQVYQICELTSLTGGTFNPGLSLTFEKQLVVMGTVDITNLVIVPADAQLATDYQSVSSENPPAKKAKDMHAEISSDNNAEKLCDRYEPHVCITREGLVTLLDNHGPDFNQRWELPVCIRDNHGKGVTQKKTVYIESPIIDNEITVRRMSHIYHEESLKLSVVKNGKRSVFHLMSELPVGNQEPPPEASKRNVVCLSNDDLNFEVDLTDLETFGEAPLSKISKIQKSPNEQLPHGPNATSPQSTNANQLNEPLTHNSQEITHLSHSLITTTVERNEANVTKPASESEKESDNDTSVIGDSDNERLIIDDSTSPLKDATPEPRTCPTSEASTSALFSPKKTSSKRSKAPSDPMGEILRMQKAMFRASNDAVAKSRTLPQVMVSPNPCMEPQRQPQPVSLVKPCVTSYLERNQHQSGETSTATPTVHTNSPEKKKILSQDLQASAEDEQDYTSPEKGNLLYKLYSLQDVLIIVRSSVHFAQKRKASEFVPVHVLPKLNYQLCHGVECLSSSEACHLWTETALHSSTVPIVAHINAHTSKVALCSKMPETWMQNISCDFNPVKSLNILHHLLKKLTKMEAGQYLITHKAGEPFVTLLKAANGKASRTAFDLRQVHDGLPQTPTSGPVPWIPVDPSVVLPFHKKHGRVPCTFPPHNVTQQAGNAVGPTGKKKKKKKRSVKRNNYIQKLIKQSVSDHTAH
ncbi:little elongation complex subunit 2 [Stigmatopora nigra]